MGDSNQDETLGASTLRNSALDAPANRAVVRAIDMLALPGAISTVAYGAASLVGGLVLHRGTAKPAWYEALELAQFLCGGLSLLTTPIALITAVRANGRLSASTIVTVLLSLGPWLVVLTFLLFFHGDG